jgi:F0F1-type ATP synthase assembly protein I
MGTNNNQVAPEQPHDEIHDMVAAANAKTMFVEASLDMGWRLAAGFLTPILLGVWIDKYFDISPSVTITGFMIAVVLSSMVVYSAVQEANLKVAEEDKKVNDKLTTKEFDV